MAATASVSAAATPVPRPTRAGNRWLDAFTWRRVWRKLLTALVSLFAVMLTGFFLFRIIPGDPLRTMTRGHDSSPAELAALRHHFGLDRSLIQQFLIYVSQTLRGDLGTSYEYHQSVSSVIMRDLWPTVYLAGSATILAAVVGLYLGIHGAWNRGRAFDKVTTGIALTFWSVPTFWLGLIMIVVFSVGIGPIPGMFPTGGLSSPNEHGIAAIGDSLHHLVLPCLCLTLIGYAQNQMIMRASLVDEMDEDYLTTARAKGLRDAMVRRRHAVPNALLPSITLIFLQLGGVVSGAILVETVFSWHGIGLDFYQALTYPDQPLLQGLFLFFSGSVIVMNLLADLIYPVLDPRVQDS
jgi:peptide/nickel transport system permease protein